MEKPLSDQAFASSYKVAEIASIQMIAISRHLHIVSSKQLLSSKGESITNTGYMYLYGSWEFASPMVYINLEGNLSHAVTIGWAMRGLIDAEQTRNGVLVKMETGHPNIFVAKCWGIITFGLRIRSILMQKRWTMEVLSRKVLVDEGNGRIGSKVALQQLVEPAFIPPPPISWYLRGITTRKVEMMINDLLDDAARIKGVSATESNIH
uniref:Uncharacterized protein n=1 Tax=Tanacetum cinerariifolium TaxID=118510 RepID=A0A699IDQ1_TANCI|nr:hypothetical protein [Tanacetum cinerariifolium]